MNITGADIADILTAIGGIAPGLISAFRSQPDREWTKADILAKVEEYLAREGEFDKKFTTED